MAESSDPITLRIDGVEWTYWQSVEITRQLDAVAGAFSLQLTDRWANGGQSEEMDKTRALPLAAGMRCEVLIGQDMVVNGYIDRISPSFSAAEHGIAVTGRDKSADLVDCSAIHRPGHWQGLDCARLAEELARPFGVTVTAEGDVGAPFPSFKLEQGERAFDALDRALRQRELFACPDGSGGIVLLGIASRESRGRLAQGENVLAAGLDCDMTERFSDYIVQGQQPGNDEQWGLTVCAVSAETRDPSITRYRPLLVRAENSVDSAGARQRAAWEKSVRAGRSVTCTVKVQGFRQTSDGPLWQINALTEVDLPYFRLSQRLLVTKTTFRRDAGGSFTELELRDPAAFRPEPKQTAAKSAAPQGSVTIEQERDIQQRLAQEAANAAGTAT